MAIVRGPPGNVGDQGWLPPDSTDGVGTTGLPWISYIDPPTNINLTIGAYSWAGTTATTGAITVVSATPGAYSWAGTTANTSDVIGAGVGAFTWAGTTATTTELISQGIGAYSWAGTTSSLNENISHVTGTYTWAGTTAGASQLIIAIPGAYTWVGTLANVPTQINSDPTFGYTWSGSTSAVTVPSGITPAGKHRKRYGVYDGSRLLLFDTPAEAKAAQRALDKPEQKPLKRLKIKPAAIVPIAEIKAAAAVFNEMPKVTQLLAERRYTHLANVWGGLEQRLNAKRRADQDEEELAMILLHL